MQGLAPLSHIHLDGIPWEGPGVHQFMVASIGLRRNGVMGSEACL